MIHQSLIDAARVIKSEYQRKHAELDMQIESTAELKDYLDASIERVTEIEKKSKEDSYTTDRLKADVLETLEGIDQKSKQLAERIKKVNIEIESLKAQERSLYDLIKSRYPSMSDEQIRTEVQSRL